MEELKPCPFCPDGGLPTIDKSFEGFRPFADSLSLAKITCVRCGVSTTWYESEAPAIAAWNQRATPIPDTPEMVEALDNAYEAGRKSAERTCKVTPSKNLQGIVECECNESFPEYYEYCPYCGVKVVE